MRTAPRFFLLLTLGLIAGCSDGTGPGEPEPTLVDPGQGPTILLAPPKMVGDSVFPVGDTATGGQGQTVGGVSCIENIALYGIRVNDKCILQEVFFLPAGGGPCPPDFSLLRT